MTRKIISSLLVFVMVFSALPFGVMGAEENNSAWSKKTAFDEFESGKVLDKTPPWNMGGSATGESSLCKLVDDPQPEGDGDKAIRLKSTSAMSAVQASFDCNLGESAAYTTDMFVSASVLADESTKLSLKIFGAEKKGKKETELFTIKDGKFFTKVDGKLVDTGSELPLGKWVDLYVSIELGAKTYSISIDGEAITNEEGDEAFKLPYAFVSVYKAGFYSAGANSESHIDDFFFATMEAGGDDKEASGTSTKSKSSLDKWENNIDVINSVLKDRLVMAEGSPKFFNNMVAGHYVEGNNNVYPVHRGDYYIVPARSVAGSLGLDFKWDDAAKKVTFTKDGKTTTMTLGSKDATVAGKKVTLSVAPEMVNGALMVPVNEITEAAGKKLYIDDGNIKLLVIGSTAKPFNSRKKMDMKEEIARATYYERPNAEKVIADFKATPRASQHPRILLTKDRIEEIKVLVKTDPFMMDAYAKIKEEAALILKKPLPEYSDGYGGNGRTRYWGEEAKQLMIVYWVDGFDDYLQKAKDIILKLAEFPQYGPVQSLSEAEDMAAFAIAYDWMYDYLTVEERQKIKDALVEKRMKQDLLKYQRLHPDSGNMNKGGWVDWGNNFTTHGNEGVMVSIAAMWDVEPELCKELLRYFFRSMETAFVEISPDGGGREGVGYLLGGTVSQSILSFRLLTELAGTDYNYLTAPHFKKALESKINMYGSAGVFRYADENRGEGGNYPNFMWAGKFMSPLLYEDRLRELRDYPESVAPVVMDLIDYDPNFVATAGDLDLGVMYRKSEAGSFRNSFNNYFNTFLGFKGGDSVMSHSHRDLGSFVFHTDGMPWFDDHGMIYYAYANSGKVTGPEMYNHRAEGHNVMLFRNPKDLTTPPAPDKEGMIPLDYFDMEDIPVGGTPPWATSIYNGSKLEVVEDGDNKVLLFSSDSTGTGQARLSYTFGSGLCTDGFALEYDIKINHKAGDTDGRIIAMYGMAGDHYEPTSKTEFRGIQGINNDVMDGFAYEKDTWYHVKLVFNINSSTYDFYVDGKKIHKNKNFMLTPGNNLYVIQMETGPADLEYVVDNFKFSIANNEHNFASVAANMQKKDDQSISAVSKIQNFTNGEGAGFATAELGAVYPNYTKDYKRAFGLFQNREVMVIRDEATVEKDCETWWFGHTVADITLSEDGKSAILTDAKSGKRLWVGIMSNGPEKFTTMPVEPFKESPNIRAEVMESMFAGKQKLTIMNNRKKGEKIALTVMATPLYGDEVAPSKLPEVKPISEWKDEPYTGARLSGILLDGVPLEGFDPNQRYYEKIYTRYDIDPPMASIPQVSVPQGVNAVIKQAQGVGDTATITVGEGANARTYYVAFDEIVEIYIDPANIPVFDPPFAPTGKVLNAGDYQIAFDSTRRSYGFQPIESVYTIDNWFDGDFATNHSIAPVNAFEDIDLGDVVPVSALEIAFANGLKRQDVFSLYASTDGENWECILSENKGSGKTTDFERFSFPTVNARWLRFVSHGNSTGSMFCNMSEVRIRK